MYQSTRSGAKPVIECQGISLKGEQPLLETVGMTAERLQSVEQRLFRLESLLFGPMPTDAECCADPKGMPNVSDCAKDAFRTSVRIQELLDNLIQRIES